MAAARTVTAPRRRTSGIRWDRVGRWAMLMLIGGVLLLYIGPAHSWYVTWRDARAKHAAVEKLRAANAQLRARRDALLRTSTLEREARRLGMVRPGERPYVIEGLPQGR